MELRRGHAGNLMPMFSRLPLLSVTIIIAVLGCAPAQETKPSSVEGKKALRLAGGGQIIIKFRNPAIDPSRPETLADLSASAGTPLEFIRSMSGGAFVLMASGLSDIEQLTDLVRRLDARADVETVAPDRQLYHQSSPNSAK